jgi:hypothetical protein
MADSRTMIDRARIECQNHWFIYNEKMSVESVAQAVSNLAIQFGDSDDDGGAMVKQFHSSHRTLYRCLKCICIRVALLILLYDALNRSHIQMITKNASLTILPYKYIRGQLVKLYAFLTTVLHGGE